MRKLHVFRPWSLVCLCALSAPLALATESPGGWREKVHPRVLQAAETGSVEFIVFLEDQADLASATGLRGREARGRRVFDALRLKAAETQGPILARLAALGVEYRPYWIANMVWVRGDQAALEAVASMAEVRRVDANPEVALAEPAPGDAESATTGGVPEWGVAKIQAPQVWALGYDGSGVVIGGQDTGYDWDHPALLSKYRGWDGTTADHAYNWHDAIHSGGGSCGHDSPVPCDDHGHGTHTMGTMVGDDGGVNQIGVAPGAHWIGCRNMDQGVGTPATYAECFQWFVAPTDANGQNPDPSKAPQVINNSWGCPPDEGCSADTLRTVVENTRAAGIVVVVSAGNYGPNCSTVEDPPAIYAASFSVGATDSSDDLAGFSSRGPVSVDGSGRRKPDVAAPGVSVRSAQNGGGYTVKSGTSMAGPHVAGLVALLLQARPASIGHVGEVEELIEADALPVATGEVCGGILGTDFPNNSYGYGRIDALATVIGDPDGDGVDNRTDCAPLQAAAWADPEPVEDLTLDQQGVETVLSWDAPAGAGGGTLRYDVLRSAQADDFSSASCLRSFQAASNATDAASPSPIYYYLVRIRNACGANLGSDSDGAQRSGALCLIGDF